MSNLKRVSIYLNLDNPDEEMIWTFLSPRKKNAVIRSILLEYIRSKSNPVVTPKCSEDSKSDILDKVSLDVNELDF